MFVEFIEIYLNTKVLDYFKIYFRIIIVLKYLVLINILFHIFLFFVRLRADLKSYTYGDKY